MNTHYVPTPSGGKCCPAESFPTSERGRQLVARAMTVTQKIPSKPADADAIARAIVLLRGAGLLEAVTSEQECQCDRQIVAYMDCVAELMANAGLGPDPDHHC